jgi:hypothetical protein
MNAVDTRADGATKDAITRRATASRDNTMTTKALRTRSRSSIVRDEMGVSAAIGKHGHGLRKVEGLVVRLDRGSSNLPGRIPRRSQGFWQPR